MMMGGPISPSSTDGGTGVAARVGVGAMVGNWVGRTVACAVGTGVDVEGVAVADTAADEVGVAVGVGDMTLWGGSLPSWVGTGVAVGDGVGVGVAVDLAMGGVAAVTGVAVGDTTVSRCERPCRLIS